MSETISHLSTKTRITFVGDKTAAREYVGEANKLLFQHRRFMEDGKTASKMRRHFEDSGVTMLSTIINGREHVTIIAPVLSSKRAGKEDSMRLRLVYYALRAEDAKFKLVRYLGEEKSGISTSVISPYPETIIYDGSCKANPSGVGVAGTWGTGDSAWGYAAVVERPVIFNNEHVVFNGQYQNASCEISPNSVISYVSWGQSHGPSFMDGRDYYVYIKRHNFKGELIWEWENITWNLSGIYTGFLSSSFRNTQTMVFAGSRFFMLGVVDDATGTWPPPYELLSMDYESGGTPASDTMPPEFYLNQLLTAMAEAIYQFISSTRYDEKNNLLYTMHAIQAGDGWETPWSSRWLYCFNMADKSVVWSKEMPPPDPINNLKYEIFLSGGYLYDCAVDNAGKITVTRMGAANGAPRGRLTRVDKRIPGDDFLDISFADIQYSPAYDNAKRNG